MATKFFDLLNKYYRTSPDFKASVQAAKEWFRNAAQQVRITDPQKATDTYTKNASRARLVPKLEISGLHVGRMIIFSYDPKHKDTLPYYDILPVVIPFKLMKSGKSAGFLGLNLHYLPPAMRAKLMDALYSHYKQKHLTERARLQLDYQLLVSSARYKWFRPCVKHYLFTHIRSKLNVVDPKEWDMVMMLPLARWRKADETRVWSDSRRKIRNSG